MDVAQCTVEIRQILERLDRKNDSLRMRHKLLKPRISRDGAEFVARMSYHPAGSQPLLSLASGCSAV